MVRPANLSLARSETDDPWRETRWYAVYTKPSREQFAATNVELQGLEVFLPRLHRRAPARRHHGGHARPLFPGYFFARMRPATDLDGVRYAPGVLHVVSSCSKPAPVHDAIIAGLKERAREDGCIHFMDRDLRTGDEVTIGDGPFRGLVARFERECDDGLRVMLLLNSIADARVCLQKDCLEPAL